ncbi:hypothetical protein HQ520_12360 [bacterium]|nr:hypothetical protein [bacterium]
MSQIRVGVRLTAILVLLAAVSLLSGCRYSQNRLYDFCDVFQLGAGVTFENAHTGMVPPSLGIHAQVSDFVNLGAIHFTGATAEMDGRGFFAGSESRTRIGFLPIQLAQIQQDYEFGRENYFKKENTSWDSRMQLKSMTFRDVSAKELHYASAREWLHKGTPLFPRGWHYWLTTSLEVAVADPFLTHAGLHLRLGVDVSEISDFVLGIFAFDFKHDDLTVEDYAEKRAGVE